jgi:hypothetical protein
VEKIIEVSKGVEKLFSKHLINSDNCWSALHFLEKEIEGRQSEEYWKIVTEWEYVKLHRRNVFHEKSSTSFATRVGGSRVFLFAEGIKL